MEIPPKPGEVRIHPKDGQPYVWIPPGTFRMGASPGDGEAWSDERPAHDVTISRGFWLGQTPVTQEAYERVIGSNPSQFRGARLPVEQVSWQEAEAYANAIGMRLPAEAEWEYAARAGVASPAYGPAGEIAWHRANSGGRTHDVWEKNRPNGFGLHDMLGNVWEWVADWFASYGAAPETDPSGPSGGSLRVMRGCSWKADPLDIRVSFRGGNGIGIRGGDIGFRVAGESL